MMCLTVYFMQQHLSLINRHVNTVKDVPAREFIKAFAAHLKQNNKFKIPAVSDRPVYAFNSASAQMCASRSLFVSLQSECSFD